MKPLEIITGTDAFQLHSKTAVAIGKFDGVHRGHKRLLGEILKQKKMGLLSCVFTFDPPPNVLFGGEDTKVLTTMQEKRRIFEAMGVDILIEFPLTQVSAAIEPEIFVKEILVEKLQVRFVAAGTDLSFGNKGKGDGVLLQKMAEELGFFVRLIDKVTEDGEEISSSGIRKQLRLGQMQKITKLLGEPYSVSGKVEHGKRIGRTLGFPTVNISPDEDKALPPFGVYLAKVIYNGREYRGISNIGCKPTVSDERKIGVETYLYDFHEEIYEAHITVYLMEFHRPEMHFADLEALKEQLKQDIAWGKGADCSTGM